MCSRFIYKTFFRAWRQRSRLSMFAELYNESSDFFAELSSCGRPSWIVKRCSRGNRRWTTDGISKSSFAPLCLRFYQPTTLHKQPSSAFLSHNNRSLPIAERGTLGYMRTRIHVTPRIDQQRCDCDGTGSYADDADCASSLKTLLFRTFGARLKIAGSAWIASCAKRWHWLVIKRHWVLE